MGVRPGSVCTVYGGVFFLVAGEGARNRHRHQAWRSGGKVASALISKAERVDDICLYGSGDADGIVVL